MRHEAAGRRLAWTCTNTPRPAGTDHPLRHADSSWVASAPRAHLSLCWAQPGHGAGRACSGYGPPPGLRRVLRWIEGRWDALRASQDGDWQGLRAI